MLLHDKTALIVDDNETNRRIVETMLKHWGMRAISVDSGAKALASLDRAASAAQVISLVISDLHMPEMDGFQLIAAIRAALRRVFQRASVLADVIELAAIRN